VLALFLRVKQEVRVLALGVNTFRAARMAQETSEEWRSVLRTSAHFQVQRASASARIQNS